MLTFHEALERVLERATPLEAERVPLAESEGRILSETLCASGPLPPFDYSAMDGYAVDTADFDAEGPWSLQVIGESRTGHPAPSLMRGTACRIFTGAKIPEGATAVVAQEDVQRVDGVARFESRPARGAHIRTAGEDLEAGAVALPAGTRIGPYQLGLIASLDLREVLVSRRPRVTILATGDELRPPGTAGPPGTIPESNGIVVRALAQAAGAIVTTAPRARDDRRLLKEVLEKAIATSDVLASIGGVSVGEYDLVRPALERAGARLDFWKVAIRPGKPLALGTSGRCVILGLPGNPVSAQVTFTLFGLPLLRAIQGAASPRPRFVRSTLSAPIRQNPGRLGFYRGVLEGDRVTPLPAQSSGATTSMAWANALIVIPAESDGAPAGAAVSVLPFEPV